MTTTGGYCAGFAGLVADMLVTEHSYTDQFFLARRREPMSVAAEIQ
ncbi:hypothetical protein SHIRM173S_12454 [Streptomyces hirsutus]